MNSNSLDATIASSSKKTNGNDGKDGAVWMTIVKCLIHPHSWVKQVSCRIIWAHVSALHPTTLSPIEVGSSNTLSFVKATPGAVYEIARNVCHQLGGKDEELNDVMVTQAVKILTWVVQVMHHQPKLCFKSIEDETERQNNTTKINNSNDSGDEDDNDTDVVNADTADNSTTQSSSKNPVAWLMTRLSQIAKTKSATRRDVVFKCFAAFTSTSSAIMTPHLSIILQPLHRALNEAESRILSEGGTPAIIDHGGGGGSCSSTSFDEISFIKQVMQLVEDVCGTQAYVEAYLEVKTRADERRETRKREMAVEAVVDPKMAAERKIKKQAREKERRRRKIEEKKMGVRGGSGSRKKMRMVID
mmetsp:Transcript_3150/g.4047  ORF Transcript_3150/g.4047 Transcript_3150/m.4047 type:complete len:359 (+) Transcript_3150:3-1079(+)